ncbi:regulator [Cytobacillus depressus]|uniref:Regulator n=1 Tax=Cytobacillus depressus TaxID=1602942 RepID=A0A6L3VC28_9BACI|nr:intercompartmental signaling factor BofC [Cytobacillus depressus]KAB2338692.1 regulator [Cytobacillus depressus]
MRNKWAFVIFALCLAGLFPFQLNPLHVWMNGKTALANSEVDYKERVNDPITINVVLERMYMDGEVSQEWLTEEIWSMENFWAKYEEWQLIDMDEDQAIFRKYMDDISPLLKANGYFGITDEGVLTIFNGKPQKMNIIQSFFQIDIGRLESKKCEELKEGIPIKTKEQYVEVLETFQSYSKTDEQAN